MGIIIKQSILSGILVGIGVVINTLTSNQYVGAMLFSLALLVIIKCELKLYTGKIGYFSVASIKDLIIMLIGNLIGVTIPFLIALNKEGIYEQIFYISEIKFSNGYLELFLYGLMCGVLMFIAVHCKKPIITVFCIMTFILSGYEHCVADFPYLCINFNIGNLLKFICIILGNSLGSIAINRLITTPKKQQNKINKLKGDK